MKSLVEEASSIAKAIEKAWERAGKPSSFSVKIYETGEKNFLGFTKKSAKVGIFFEEEFAKSQDRRHYGQDNRNSRSHKNQSGSYTNRLERGVENSERADRSPRNTSQEPKTNYRQNQKQHRFSEDHLEASDNRTENRSDNNHENKNENGRYIREKNRDFAKKNDHKNDRLSSRRQNDKNTQRSQKTPSDHSDKNYKEPLVQPYPNSEIIMSEHSAPTQTQNAPQERPVMTIPIGQTQRKVLKVSSRRYVSSKPTEPVEIKKTSE